MFSTDDQLPKEREMKARITTHNEYQKAYLAFLQDEFGEVSLSPVVNNVYELTADGDTIERVKSTIYEIGSVHDLMDYCNSWY